MLNEIIVVKVGTSTLTRREENGREALDVASFRRIGKQVSALHRVGSRVVVVSSAAITAGLVVTGRTERPSRTDAMPELQRLASIGWRHVVNAWHDALPGHTVAELLLTRAELDMTGPRREALQVLHTLLEHGDIPVINENDAVAHEQIAYGDNDTLAATVAAHLAQQYTPATTVRLILLSDVEGVYADKHSPSTRIPLIRDLTHYGHLAEDSTSRYGTGGMATKFAAARIAAQANVETWVAHGRMPDAIAASLEGRTGTHFALSPPRLSATKRRA